jgi:hypothetical protein
MASSFEDIITNKRERTYSQVFFEFGESIPPTNILPGHFYSLVNTPQVNINESTIPTSFGEWSKTPTQYVTEKQYFDVNPVGLALYHENWRQRTLIINLKIIPPVFRAKLLAAYYFISEKFISNLYQNDKLIPFNERGTLNLPFYGISQAVLQQVSGLNLNYAINKYRVEDLNTIRFLDWDKFGELPFANIEDRGLIFARGFDLSDIFEVFEQKQ